MIVLIGSEDQAQQPKLDRGLRPVVTDLGAGDHGNENPCRE